MFSTGRLPNKANGTEMVGCFDKTGVEFLK